MFLLIETTVQLTRYQMHQSACAFAHADKCIYFQQVHMLTHAAYHFNSSVQRVIDQSQVSRALCNFGR